MEFEPNQIFTDDYPSEAAAWCNESGLYHIEEIEPENGQRRFQIVENPQPTPEELAEQENQRLAAEAEAARIPDLEDAVCELGAVVEDSTAETQDAVLDLAAYVAELEERLAALEAKEN